MRHTTVTAVAAAALLLTGCGAQSGRPADGSPSASPSSTGTPGPGGGSGTAGACATEVELTVRDTGRVVCVTTGGTVRVTLDGTPDRPWAPVTSEGAALTPTNAGIGAPRGDAIAAYRATAPGTAHLNSTQPLCATPTAPGQVACLGLRQWAVTVRVANG